MMFAVIFTLTAWYMALAYLTFHVLTKTRKDYRDWRVIVATIFWPGFWLVALVASLLDTWKDRAHG